MSQAVRGYILQPTYRIESGRPVVHLFGRLEDGQSFLIRDDRLSPSFWIRQDDSERATEAGARTTPEPDRRTLQGVPLTRVDVATPSDAPPMRNRLQDRGIACYEADVRFAMRYLMTHQIRSTLEISGRSHKGKFVDRIFENPRIDPTDWHPTLSVLSIDIETDPGPSTSCRSDCMGAARRKCTC